MGARTDLLQAHLETLYILDEAGDILSSNEPNPRGRRAALHLAWCEDGYLVGFRFDVPDAAREQVQDLAASLWPFGDRRRIPEEARFRDILADFDTGKGRTGPAFVVPADWSPSQQAVSITAANAEVATPDFVDSVEDAEASQPIYAVIVDGRAVSACQTVRRCEHGIEAGVDTLAAHRRQGHGRRVVAAWGAAAVEAGVTGFYSTWWENEASCALAGSLGWPQCSVEFKVA